MTSDAEFIRSLKQQDEQAVLELWELLFRDAERICAKWNLDEDIGRDAAVRVYYQMMDRGIWQFKFQSKFRSYCWSALTHAIVRKWKYDPAQHQVELVEEIAASPDEQAASLDPLEKVQPCLDELPEREQKVVSSFYLEEQHPESIAGMLGITRNYVDQLLWRARKKLKECLEQHGFHSFEDLAIV